MKKASVLLKFGAKLRAERLKRKLSQEKLAELAELHRNYIGLLERSEQSPSLIHIEKIAKALDISISKLMKF
jgi:transcriptional regulator with XRE-family HTH domain